MSQVLAYVVKQIAEGAYGGRLKAAYWWLAGKKTKLSIGCYGVWLVLWSACRSQLPPELVHVACQWEVYVFGAANTMLAIGLFDAAVRLEPPKK
jgi:hypothetical protein